jgi:hypothetical protein
MSYRDLAGLVTLRPMSGLFVSGQRGRPSPFRASWSSTVEILADELRHLRASRVVLEIDMTEADFRNDGLPRANARAASPGVVLSMDVPGSVGHLRYEVATFDHWQDNVRAIALGLRALRAVDRYGITKRGEQYAGWRALPPGTPSGDVGRGRTLIEQAGGLAAARRVHHPDHGGQVNDFLAVQAAADAGVGTR